jgi:hypothetical protein
LPANAQQPGYSTYQGTGQFPLSNPFYMSLGAPSAGAIPGPSGYTPASCALGAGPKKIFVVFGQSLAQSSANDTYAVTNPTKNLTFDIFTGTCFQSQYAPVGVPAIANGSYLVRTCDNLITNDSISGGCIIVPVMSGGTLVAQWTQASATSFPYLWNNIAVIAHMLAGAGLTPTEIVWEIGTSDCINGTSQSAFSSAFAGPIAQTEAMWPGVPVLINQESFNGTSVCSAIQAAQTAAVDGVSTFHGGNTDAVGNTGRWGTPPLHFNSAGAPLAASSLEAAIVAH